MASSIPKHKVFFSYHYVRGQRYADILALEQETEGLLAEIVGE